jgi:thiamine-phosphate pyrophosphorylase
MSAPGRPEATSPAALARRGDLADALRLYLVSDLERCPRDRFLALLPDLVEAGVSMVQLRDKASSTRELVRFARALKDALGPRGVPLIVNDRADVAFAAGADGVHVGRSDLAPGEARRLLGPDAIIGASVESMAPDELEAAREADYLAVSPVFATPSKLDAAPPLGLEGVEALRARVDLPTVGIGGIDAENAEAVTRAGASGVAVISAILSAEAPAEAARALRASVERGRR